MGGGGGVAFVGHLSFFFGKAANAPRSGQMFIEKPTVGLKNRVIPGQHQNCIFQLQIPYLWEICNIRTRSDFEKHLTIKNCDETFLKIILRLKNC